MKLKNTFIFILLLFFINAEDSLYNEYFNKFIGLKLKYPKNWHQITIDDYISNYKEQYTVEQIKEMLKKNKLPIFEILKYKEPYDDINPHLSINIYPYPNNNEKDLKKMVILFLGFAEKNLQNYKLIENIKEYKLKNKNSYYAKIYHSLLIDNKEYKLCSEKWFVDLGQLESNSSWFMQIMLTIRQDEKNINRAEISEIINNIEIE